MPSNEILEERIATRIAKATDMFFTNVLISHHK